MKKVVFIVLLLTAAVHLQAQIKSFRFIHISDTHIGSPNGAAEEDLRRTVHDINQMNDVAFVILTGDITELGTDAQIAKAKQILDSLKVKYYIIPGNHDTGWSESGGVSFTRAFGYDKFQFDHNGIRFIGCASGPYVRMSDGHIPRNAIVWLDSLLAQTPKEQPIIFCNHYPIDNGLDNWYVVFDGRELMVIWFGLEGVRRERTLQVSGASSSFRLFQMFSLFSGKRFSELGCPLISTSIQDK